MSDDHRPAGPGKTLLLAGGGHAHVEVLRRHIDSPDPALRLHLISPTDRLAYSGMLPATIAGHYAFDDMHVDLTRLAQAAGAGFIRSRVSAIEADGHRLTLADGRVLAYDLLSLDIGSTPASMPRIEPSIPVVPVKPIESLWAGLDRLETLLSTVDRTAQLAVAGGGAGSVELILALAHRYRRRRRPPQLTLYSATDRLLDTHPGAVRRRLLRALDDAGIHIQSGRPVAATTPHGVRLANGDNHPADALFCATGARAPSWLADTHLGLDSRGFVAVGWDLASRSHANVFAVGDICSLPEPRPKSGVFAVRAAPTLATNLGRRAGRQPLRYLSTPRRSLALITMGGRQAVASRGWPIAPAGYAVWRLKDRIDRGFIDRYERNL